jgi:hypothetical protein
MTEQALAKMDKIDKVQPTSIAPKQKIKFASEASNALIEVVKKGGLAKNFGGEKDHLFFEAWQTVGQFYGATPKVEWSKPLMVNNKIYGYEARAVVLQGGEEIGAAEAACMKDEGNWESKPLFQLKSMAQTRAQAKALRSCFAWVVVLAGYSATPAEELTGNEFSKLPSCPKCGKDAIIKGKEEYGGGYLCFKKKGGCGAKFKTLNDLIPDKPKKEPEPQEEKETTPEPPKEETSWEVPQDEGSDDELATEKQRKMLWARLKGDLRLSNEIARNFIVSITGKESGKTLTRGDVSVLLEAIETELQNKKTNFARY